jgi:hypothetical protein
MLATAPQFDWNAPTNRFAVPAGIDIQLNCDQLSNVRGFLFSPRQYVAATAKDIF